MAEKEYIEKQAAIELLRDNINLPIDSGTARAYWTRVVEIKDALIGHISKIPAADVVDVVRCENCKHSRDRNDGVLICTSSDASDVCWNPVYPTHFCSYGKRKEATPCSK